MEKRPASQHISSRQRREETSGMRSIHNANRLFPRLFPPQKHLAAPAMHASASRNNAASPRDPRGTITRMTAAGRELCPACGSWTPVCKTRPILPFTSRARNAPLSAGVPPAPPARDRAGTGRAHHAASRWRGRSLRVPHRKTGGRVKARDRMDWLAMDCQRTDRSASFNPNNAGAPVQKPCRFCSDDAPLQQPAAVRAVRSILPGRSSD